MVDQPFTSAKFLVEIEGVSSSGFSHVKLPRQELRPVVYREGADGAPRVITTGIVAPEYFTVSRGVTTDGSLFDWWKQERDGAAPSRGATVILLDESSSELTRWNLSDCRPVAYWLSPLDAMSTETLVETLAMAAGRLERA